MKDLTLEQKIERLRDMIRIDEENMEEVKPLLMNCPPDEEEEHKRRYNKCSSRIRGYESEIAQIESQIIKQREEDVL